MKNFMLFASFLFLTFTISTGAVLANDISLEARVVKTYYPEELRELSKTICVSVLEEEGERVVLVEDVAFCFYARSWRGQTGRLVQLEEQSLNFEIDRTLNTALAERFKADRIIVLETE